jgi:hypothetical protein
MPRETQMSALVTRAQQLADMENDSSISSAEWYALVSEAYGEAYEIIASAGTRYFEYTTTFTTDGTNYLAEPTDMLSTVDQLELIIDSTTGRCRRLRLISPQERSRYSGQTGTPRAYELVDGRYFLYPTPPAGQTITLRYIGQAPDLTTYTGTNVVDCFCAAGQKFVQYAAAAAAVQKSKNDATALLAERESQRKPLSEWSADRHFNAQTVWYVDDDGDGDLPANWSW